MSDDSNSTVGEYINTIEFDDTKVIVICIIIILNVIINSLVIAVIARNPQLRADRTTLFMFSLSLSDLASGCTCMPISAFLCSRATPEVVDMVDLLPKVQFLFTWWFGFNSMYSLCCLTVAKAIVILKPLRADNLLPYKRCYVFIAVIWILGGVLAALNFNEKLSWNLTMCAYRLPRNRNLPLQMVHFLVGVVLPVSVILYGTLRIFIVVVRTHRHISTQEQSIGLGRNPTGNLGFVTLQAIRSSTHVILICVMSLVLSTPLFVFIIIRYITDFPISDMFSFASLWIFQSNTFVNSLLYLVLFKSVRQKVMHMFHEIYGYTRSR